MADSSAENAKSLNLKGRALQVVVYGLPNNFSKKQFHKYITHHVQLSKVEVELLKESDLFEVQYPTDRAMIATVSARKHVATLVKAIEGITVNTLVRQFNALEKKEHSKNAKSDAPFVEYKPDSTNQFIKCRSVVDIDNNIERRKQYCRVIIRNISFQATVENITSKVLKFGPIVELKLPLLDSANADSAVKDGNSNDNENEKEASKEKKLKHRGFAFVTFLCQKDAEAAIAMQTGENASPLKICNREVAMDFCDHKTGFERKKMLQTLEQNSGEKSDGDKVTGKEPNEGGDTSKKEVDDMEEPNDAMDIEEEEEEDADLGEHEDEEDGSSVEEEEEEEEDVEAEKTDLNDAAEGKTVFIRDLLADVTARDVKTAIYTAMGSCNIVMAVIVKDKITGASKGSAFVKFDDANDAIRCSEDFAESIVIQGKTCRITIALEKSKAEQLRIDQKNQIKDKRHTYLLNEGVLMLESNKKGNNEDGAVVAPTGVTGFTPNAQWIQSMSEEDKDKRTRALSEKKKKLLNPLFFLSSLRLSIRNLHKDVTDKNLNSLCMKALMSGMGN